MDSDPYPSSLNLIGCAIDSAENFMTLAPPALSALVAIVVAIIALMVSAFVSGSETAYFSLSSADMERIEPNRRARVKSLLEKPERLLATISITNILMNVAVVLLSSYALSQIFVFESVAISFVFQAVVIVFFILLFGELLPKLYAESNKARCASMTVGGLSVLSRCLAPLSDIVAKSTYFVNKVVPKKTDDLSLDDLSHALEMTNVAEEKDKSMLEEILKFGGKTVADIMTSRVDMTCVDWNSPFSELVEMVKESGYSRLPVYVDNQDNIKGIIYAKDLLPYVGRMDDTFEWQTLLRAPFFVPETRMIDDILEDFQKKKMHMAIVVDEYGGTEGLVTLEDVLEEIVGEISDEYDEDEKLYTRLANDTYVFEGKTLLNDFYRITGLEEQEFGEMNEDAETLAGLLLNIKQDFPKEKEVIEYGRCRFLVMSIDKHRIEKVKVRILADAKIEDKD